MASHARDTRAPRLRRALLSHSMRPCAPARSHAHSRAGAPPGTRCACNSPAGRYPACYPHPTTHNVGLATSTTWGGPVAKSHETLVLCRPRRRSPCPRSAIRACFSTGGTSRGLGGVPNVQRSRNFMGALDAHAHRAASAAQTAARMVNGSRDNVCVVGLPLLHDDSMCTWCGRNILLPRRPRARRLAD